MAKLIPRALQGRKRLDEVTFRVDFDVSLSQHGGDPSDFITVYHGNIIGIMEDESELTIGKLIVYLVERGRVLNEGISLFEVMDCLDGDSCDCFANLFGEDTEEIKPAVERLLPGDRIFHSDMMLIEQLELNAEYRGRGLGREIALRAIEKLGANCGVITCVPVPLQFTGLGPKEKVSRERERRSSGYGSFGKM